jgi:tetratricopeptide (TPR) repeat protein
MMNHKVWMVKIFSVVCCFCYLFVFLEKLIYGFMKRILFLSGFVMMSCCIGFAQHNYWQRFSEEFERKDTLKLKEILQKWQNDSPEDADLHASWFNFYLLRAITETMQITTAPPVSNVEALVLTDSLGNEVGYMYGAVRQDSVLLEKAYDWLDKGIQKHPDRLDLRYGKITCLLGRGDYKRFLKDVQSALDYSLVIKNHWKWTLDEQLPIEEGQEIFLNGMQDYFVSCFEANTSESESAAMELVKMVLKYYPDDMKFRTNQATVYYMKGEYVVALQQYLNLLEDYPNDTILLGNIAYIYTLKEDKPNAIRYYQRMLEVGNEEEKEFARKNIQELKESR